MKIYHVLVGIILLFMLLAVPSALAQETDESSESAKEISEFEDELSEVDAGIGPDNALYGLDRALDRLLIAGNNEDFCVKVARERLEEIKQAIEDGEPDAVSRAQEAHDKALELCEDKVEIVRDRERNEERAMLRLQKVKAALEADREVLESEIEPSLLVKIEVEGELTEEQRARLLEFMQSVRESQGELEFRIDSSENDLIARIATESGRTEAEIRDDFSDFYRRKRLRAFMSDDGTLVEQRYRLEVEIENARLDDFNHRAILDRVLEDFATSKESADRLLEIIQVTEAHEAHDVLHELEEDEGMHDDSETHDEVGDDVMEGEVSASPTITARVTDQVEGEVSLTPGERLRFEAEIDKEINDDGSFDVEIKLRARLRFLMDTGVTRDQITTAVAEKSQVTREEFKEALHVEVEVDEESPESCDREIRVKRFIADDISYIEYDFNCREIDFTIPTTDEHEVLNVLSVKTGLSTEELEQYVEMRIEDGAFDIDEDEAIGEDVVDNSGSEEEPECTVDSECDSGKACISGDCTSVDCVINADCESGTSCVEYECVDSSEGNESSGSTNAPECTVDSECDSGKACIENECVSVDCVTVEDCDADETCVEYECIVAQETDGNSS